MDGRKHEIGGAQNRAARLLSAQRCSITQRARLRAAARRLPDFWGRPVCAEFRPRLTIANGKLLSDTGRGTEVHAACFIPQRKITFDSHLLERPRELQRIVTHEVFHFVWSRLGNPLREEFDELLRREMEDGARGELGYSADVLKARMTPSDWKRQTLRWRHYRCESFCDTAAWYFCRGQHSEYTLAPRFRDQRELWFGELLGHGPLSI